MQGNRITVDGPEAERVARLFDELVLVLQSGPGPRRRQGGPHHRHGARGPPPLRGAATPRSSRAAGGQTVRPNTAGQKRYTDAIAENIITFGIGPAGTGKSYLAVALAVQALQSRQVNRIILTRPAVEAGERLGLPARRPHGQGRPVPAPALRRPLRPARARGRPAAAWTAGTIEVAPLAFMRGRTLNSSFIILDEAQNTTPEQMKMFLTRIGFGSQVRGHRRRHPDRRGRGAARGWSGSSRCSAGSRASPSCTSPGATWCATRSWPTSSTPTRSAERPRRRDPRTVTHLTSSPPTSRADQPVDLDRWVALARRC